MGDVKYPIRSTARKYHDMDGNEVTLSQLIRLEPEWARNVMLSLEEKLTTLQAKLNTEEREHRLTKLALRQVHDSYKQADEAHTRIETQLTTLQAENREKLAAFMIRLGFSTGHGDSVDDLLTELEWQIKELRGTVSSSQVEIDGLRAEKEGLEGELGRLRHVPINVSVAVEYLVGALSGEHEEIRSKVTAIKKFLDGIEHPTQAKTLAPVTHTGRGFELIEFIDRHGTPCTLQQSSAADYTQPGISAVWLGVCEERMHLSLEQVEALINHLKQWTETGSFVLPTTEQEGCE